MIIYFVVPFFILNIVLREIIGIISKTHRETRLGYNEFTRV